MSKYKVGQRVYVAEQDRFGNIEHVWEADKHCDHASYRVEGCMSEYGGLYFAEDKVHPLNITQRLLRIEKALGLDVDNDEEIG